MSLSGWKALSEFKYRRPDGGVQTALDVQGPFVLGHDVAGVVTKVGPEVSQSVTKFLPAHAFSRRRGSAAA